MKAMEINVLAPDEVAETGRITYPSDMPKDITIKDDGTIATLSNSSLGKIVRQKILNVRRIINSFPSLLENSIFMLQEDEYEHEGHPARPGIENYRHYVNKFMCDGNEYYIRFTLQVHGVSQDINRAEAFLHMAELSDVVVDIAIEKAPSQLDSRSNGATKPDAYFIDKKLQYFLNPVKWETGQLSLRSVEAIIDILENADATTPIQGILGQWSPRERG